MKAIRFISPKQPLEMHEVPISGNRRAGYFGESQSRRDLSLGRALSRRDFACATDPVDLGA